MTVVASVLLSVPSLGAEPSIAIDDLAPVVAFIAVILIIGFAVAAAGWVIKRDP